MKSLNRVFVLLTFLIILITSNQLERRNSSKSTKNKKLSKNKGKVKNNAKNLIDPTTSPKELKEPNYITSTPRVKLNYDKIDKVYKNEGLKDQSIVDRETELYKHTIKKVFTLFDVEDQAIDNCISELKPKLMILMLKIFSERANSGNEDLLNNKFHKIIPRQCREPLKKMHDGMSLKMNPYLDLIREFKKTRRFLRKERKTTNDKKRKVKK